MSGDSINQGRSAALDEQQSPFLELPAEIRVKIYQLVLVPGRDTKAICDALSSTCKQIRDEVQDEALRFLEFYFEQINKQFERYYGFPLRIQESRNLSDFPQFTIQLPLPALVKNRQGNVIVVENDDSGHPSELHLSQIYSKKIQDSQPSYGPPSANVRVNDSKIFCRAFKGLAWYFRLLSRPTAKSWLHSVASSQPDDALLVWEESDPVPFEIPRPLFYRLFWN
jgi:hypothetical protein